jgi:hypothetical protein
VVKKVNSPNLKLMLDMFHLQHLHGNLTLNIKELLPHVGEFAQSYNYSVNTGLYLKQFQGIRFYVLEDMQEKLSFATLMASKCTEIFLGDQSCLLLS